VDLDGEAAGRPGREAHRDRESRRQRLLEVVAVQVDRHPLVGRPSQRDLVSLPNRHDLLLLGQRAIPDREV
jgi:hypothetical protein